MVAMQESDLYHEEILTLMPGLQNCNITMGCW